MEDYVEDADISAIVAGFRKMALERGMDNNNNNNNGNRQNSSVPLKPALLAQVTNPPYFQAPAIPIAGKPNPFLQSPHQFAYHQPVRPALPHSAAVMQEKLVHTPLKCVVDKKCRWIAQLLLDHHFQVFILEDYGDRSVLDFMHRYPVALFYNLSDFPSFNLTYIMTQAKKQALGGCLLCVQLVDLNKPSQPSSSISNSSCTRRVSVPFFSTTNDQGTTNPVLSNEVQLFSELRQFATSVSVSTHAPPQLASLNQPYTSYVATQTLGPSSFTSPDHAPSVAPSIEPPSFVWHGPSRESVFANIQRSQQQVQPPSTPAVQPKSSFENHIPCDITLTDFVHIINILSGIPAANNFKRHITSADSWQNHFCELLRFIFPPNYPFLRDWDFDDLLDYHLSGLVVALKQKGKDSPVRATLFVDVYIPRVSDYAMVAHQRFAEINAAPSIIGMELYRPEGSLTTYALVMTRNIVGTLGRLLTYDTFNTVYEDTTPAKITLVAQTIFSLLKQKLELLRQHSFYHGALSHKTIVVVPPQTEEEHQVSFGLQFIYFRHSNLIMSATQFDAVCAFDVLATPLGQQLVFSGWPDQGKVFISTIHDNFLRYYHSFLKTLPMPDIIDDINQNLVSDSGGLLSRIWGNLARQPMLHLRQRAFAVAYTSYMNILARISPRVEDSWKDPDVSRDLRNYVINMATIIQDASADNIAALPQFKSLKSHYLVDLIKPPFSPDTKFKSSNKLFDQIPFLSDSIFQKNREKLQKLWALITPEFLLERVSYTLSAKESLWKPTHTGLCPPINWNDQDAVFPYVEIEYIMQASERQLSSITLSEHDLYATIGIDTERRISIPKPLIAFTCSNTWTLVGFRLILILQSENSDHFWKRVYVYPLLVHVMPDSQLTSIQMDAILFAPSLPAKLAEDILKSFSSPSYQESSGEYRLRMHIFTVDEMASKETRFYKDPQSNNTWRDVAVSPLQQQQEMSPWVDLMFAPYNLFPGLVLAEYLARPENQNEKVGLLGKIARNIGLQGKGVRTVEEFVASLVQLFVEAQEQVDLVEIAERFFGAFLVSRTTSLSASTTIPNFASPNKSA